MVIVNHSVNDRADRQTLEGGGGVTAARISKSRDSMDDVASQIVVSCGIGRTLDIFCGEGGVVESLLHKCVDAYGLDVDKVAESRCSERVPGRFSRGSVLALPFADESFQTVVSIGCMEFLVPEDIPAALKEMYRVSRKYVFLKMATNENECESLCLTVEGRAWWEARCFEAGFRKHPAYYRINSYESLNHDGRQIAVLLEKIPSDCLMKYPLVSLREARDLHMDMMRETGSRSDAHVSRYYFAAKFIRPGDAVLDAACGLGYGTHVLHSVTRARSLMGIDGSEYAIDYARHNFGSEAVTFRRGLLPDCLVTIPSNSIDHVLCFETLEHVQDPVRLLAEFQRVLTPGGRITCSVPNDWSDETGADPNPFHLHVYSRTRLIEELVRFFDIEHLVGQTADRVKQAGDACVWLSRPRALVYLAEDQTEIEAEWLLAIAAKSPLIGSQVPYNEQVFSQDEQLSAGHALALSRDYSNPWLVRSLVSIGLRTENPALRKRWAMAIIDDPSAGAACRGAALCVLAYSELANGCASSYDWLMDGIDNYLADTNLNLNPTVLRWRVSLMYVGGLLGLVSEQWDKARRFFKGVVSAPVDRYSATLLTKPAEAAYRLGLMLASQGRTDEALQTWWDAFTRISVALGERLVQGYEVRPPTFEIREMAAALSLCGRLVAATAHGANLDLHPGIFYDETHADSVFQMQSRHAAEAQLARLHRDLLAQRLGLDEISRGKDWLELQWHASEAERARQQETLTALKSGKEWLESQWRASEAERARQQETLTALKSGKEWLESQWRASEAERARQQETLTALQSGKDWLESQWRASEAEGARQQETLTALKSGKEWLESQWRASEAERARQQETLTALQSGKEWLESQWQASEAEWARQQETLTALQSGKEWLESQWQASEAERVRQQETLTALQSGKEWLESQRKLHLMELAVRQQRIEVQQTEIIGLVGRLVSAESRLDALSTDNARVAADLVLAKDKAARLKQSRIFRFAKKLGFFDFF